MVSRVIGLTFVGGMLASCAEGCQALSPVLRRACDTARRADVPAGSAARGTGLDRRSASAAAVVVDLPDAPRSGHRCCRQLPHLPDGARRGAPRVGVELPAPPG